MTEGADNELPEISESELRLRVIYSLFEPVAKLAHRYVLPLKELKSFFEVACYHELKRASHTLEEAADTLGISRRKVADLSSRLKKNFFRPEQDHELPRRIEYMLWAGPMTEGRIHQTLSEYDEAEIDEALEQLIGRERLELVDEARTRTFTVPDSEFRLYESNWMARIDGLNNLLGNLTDAVVGRFFEEDDRAFARTLDFRMREDDIEELREMYEEVFETLKKLEQRVDDPESDQVIEMSLSTIWAPSELADPDE